MDGQKLIQVNFQLPVSALDSLSKLAEQLQKLAAAVSGQGQPQNAAEKIVEGGNFDYERFQALAERSRAAGSRTPQAEAQPVRAEVTESVQDPECAGQELSAESGIPNQAEDGPDDDVKEPDTVSQQLEDPQDAHIEDIPAVHPEAEEQTPDAPVVRMEPESLIPDAEKVWIGAEEGELPLPAAQAEELAGVETPLGAGLVVTAQPEPPVSRWTGVTEELVTPGPAPLTAEAVSLAFERDGRRYDNGFPLY